MSYTAFKKVALVSRNRRQNSNTLHVVMDYLQQLEIDLVLEAETAKAMNEHSCEAVLASQLRDSGVDLMVVIGGDGSMLHAAQIAANYDIAVVGINRGRLGFLTDINPDDLSQLINIIQGHYAIEERMLLAYLKKKNSDSYQKVIKQLNLRK